MKPREEKRKTYAKVLEEVLSLGIDLELAGLGEVERGNLGDVLILALTLLLLQLEGDAADGAALDALHQVGGVAGNLQHVNNPFPNPAGARTPHSSIERRRTLLRSLLEAMMAISSHTRLLVSKSSVNLG